jgi:hypothetical protein
VWIGGANVSAYFDSTAIFKSNIQDGDVRLIFGYASKCFSDRCSLTDDDDIVIVFEETSYSLANHLVIIKKEYANGHRTIVAVFHATHRK